MIPAKYRLRLTLQAPLLSHAAGTLSLGVDAATQRYRGRPVLNGSLIRGNLRHLLSQFSEDLIGCPADQGLTGDDIEAWFGPGPEGAADLAPQRAGLSFDFYWTLADDGPPMPSNADAPAGSAAQPLRYRIEIGANGVVEAGQIQVIESAFPVGATPVFTGEIRAPFTDAKAQAHCERWLRKALDFLPALGALKGIGFGRVLKAELDRIEAVAPPAEGTSVTCVQDPPCADRFGLVLTLDRPFNVALNAAHQPENNRYLHGEDSIPGSVIKAVIAVAAQARGLPLQAHLDIDRLVITAALPALRGRPERRLPLPLSLATFNQGRGKPPLVYDLALEPEPCLLKLGTGLAAPAFLPDWKDADLAVAEAAFGRASLRLPRLLHVRTSILRGPNVSDEGKLFALECTDPGQHLWCADIDLSLIEVPADRERVRDNLCELLAGGLEGIGKTKARAQVQVRPKPFRDPTAAAAIATAQGPRYPLLLCSPARLLPSDLSVSGINGDRALFACYAAYFAYASDSLLTLCHYFAQQDLVGGAFYQRYYRAAKNYHPEWLTRSGSVFVLAPAEGADPERLRERLATWARTGLSQAQDRYGQDWSQDPFIPENGFGEVVIDYPQRAGLAPPADGLKRITEAPR